MKVTGKTIVEIELDPLDEIRITVQTLRKALEWPDEAHINRDGNLVIDHMGYTSHSFISEVEIIRKATEEDFALQKILDALRVYRTK